VSATTTYTPEQVAATYPLFSAWHIRQLCRERKLDHLRGAKARIYLTDDGVAQLLAMHQRKADPAKTPGSGQTSRSAARRRAAS